MKLLSTFPSFYFLKAALIPGYSKTFSLILSSRIILMDLLFFAQTATWADEETSRIAGTPPGQSTKYKCGLGVTPWDQELH